MKEPPEQDSPAANENALYPDDPDRTIARQDMVRQYQALAKARRRLAAEGPRVEERLQLDKQIAACQADLVSLAIGRPQTSLWDVLLQLELWKIANETHSDQTSEALADDLVESALASLKVLVFGTPATTRARWNEPVTTS